VLTVGQSITGLSKSPYSYDITIVPSDFEPPVANGTITVAQLETRKAVNKISVVFLFIFLNSVGWFLSSSICSINGN